MSLQIGVVDFRKDNVNFGISPEDPSHSNPAKINSSRNGNHPLIRTVRSGLPMLSAAQKPARQDSGPPRRPAVRGRTRISQVQAAPQLGCPRSGIILGIGISANQTRFLGNPCEVVGESPQNGRVRATFLRLPVDP